MAEKRGLEHINLINDFNTAGCLEICKDGNWVRVISKDFRAYNGPRRITEPINQPGQGIKSYQNIKFRTYEYLGPVYMHGTNNLVTPTNKQTVIQPK